MRKTPHKAQKTVLMPMATAGTGSNQVWVYKRMPRINGVAPFTIYQGDREIGNAQTLANAMLMMKARVWSENVKRTARNKRRSK